MLLNPLSHKYAAKIDKILTCYGFNRADFYLKVLYIISLGKMPNELFSFGIYINKVEENDKIIRMHTVDGIFEGYKLTSIINDYLFNMLKNSFLNYCYEATSYLATMHGYDVEAAWCRDTYTENYVHSFNRKDNLVIDASKNIAMDYSMFEKLYLPDFNFFRMSANEYMDDPLYNFTESQPIFMMAERELKKVLK